MSSTNLMANKSKGSRASRPVRESGSSSAASPGSDVAPREQMIAEAAYFRAEQRGFTPGNEMSDWLQAEADVEGVLGTGQ